MIMLQTGKTHIQINKFIQILYLLALKQNCILKGHGYLETIWSPLKFQMEDLKIKWGQIVHQTSNYSIHVVIMSIAHTWQEWHIIKKTFFSKLEMCP